VVCVDFDGTLCEFAYPGIGDPKPGAKEALQAFRDMGYHVIIYSCRTCKWYPELFAAPGEVLDMNRKCITDMIAWLKKHDIPYDEIDDGSKGKPMGDYYIDDKGVRFDNNWPDIQRFVEERNRLYGR